MRVLSVSLDAFPRVLSDTKQATLLSLSDDLRTLLSGMRDFNQNRRHVRRLWASVGRLLRFAEESAKGNSELPSQTNGRSRSQGEVLTEVMGATDYSVRAGESSTYRGIDVVTDHIVTKVGGATGELRRHLRLLRLADAAILIGTVLWGCWLIGSQQQVAGALPALNYLTMSVIVTAGWLIALHLQEVYNPRITGNGLDEFSRVVKATVGFAAMATVLCFLLHVFLSRAFLGFTFAVGLGALLASHVVSHVLIRRAWRRGQMIGRVLAVGTADDVRHLMMELGRGQTGYEVVGAIVPNDFGRSGLDVPVIDDIDQVHSASQLLRAQHVFILDGAGSVSDLRRISWALEGTDASLAVVPRFTDVAGSRVTTRAVAGLPLLELALPRFTGGQAVAKRAVDIVLASLVVLLSAPLWMAVAAAVKFGDGGPAFFSQSRVGLRGREFKCLKFRTMTVGAAAPMSAEEWQAQGNRGIYKVRGDSRVTRVGAVLRRYSIDELPQIFNVLKGDMSLVGPRPQQPVEVAQYKEGMERRLLVRPGMTGLWQVSGRADLSVDDSRRLDLFYVDNWSVTSDLVLMAKTVRAVVGGKGAY